jgi:hypothetical protein
MSGVDRGTATNLMAQSSGQTATRRGPGRPFRRGQSGNPGGRPKSRGVVEAIRARYGDDGRALLEILHNLLVDDLASEAVRVRVAELLLAHGWGRPQDSMRAHVPANDERLLEAIAQAVGRHVSDRGVLRLIQVDVARAVGIELSPGQSTACDLTKLTVEELETLQSLMEKAQR